MISALVRKSFLGLTVRNQRLEFQKGSQLSIRIHNETFPSPRCASAIQIVRPSRSTSTVHGNSRRIGRSSKIGGQTIVRSPETSRSCSAIRPPPSKRRLSDRLSPRSGSESARPFDRTSFEDGASVFGRAHRAGIQLGGTSRRSEGFSCVSSFHYSFSEFARQSSRKFSRQWGQGRFLGGSTFEARRVITRRVAVHRGGFLIFSTESP